MEAQATREREELLRVSGNSSGDGAQKRTLLREAERGTMALQEASQMMRHVIWGGCVVSFLLFRFFLIPPPDPQGAREDASRAGNNTGCITACQRCH